MKLTRLRLLGFKSFVEPTDFLIEPGLTGVVGPNGCGKSNLVEALRWVMGETSYKSMRAAEMDDVIFSGTNNRPARNNAEVAMAIDNAQRKAPAAFNDNEMIEVVRRIEREQGSTYRINGRDVRARDIQMLFADASTGSRSPALVHQGRIGEIIQARPEQRRRVLEEAAGISGLHARRHEAELRLKAAETNLQRLDDVIAQLAAQLDALKKQARQAVRYRTVSAQVRKAEAMLYHLRYVAAEAEVADAERNKDLTVRLVAERTGAQAEASTRQARISAELPSLREAEARAAAGLQRLVIARDTLDSEEARASERVDELGRRLVQFAADIEREQRLVADAEAALARLATEEAALKTEAQESAARRTGVDARVASATEALAASEKIFAELTGRLADFTARRNQFDTAIRTESERVARVNAELAEIDAELARLGTNGKRGPDSAALNTAVRYAQVTLADAESTTVAAEARLAAARLALDAARGPLADAERRVQRLETEARTLSKLLAVESKNLWPPVLDQVAIEKGYETALGAALGDDLDAPIDPSAPMRWTLTAADHADPALPEDVEPLSAYIKAPPELARRLAQVGLVTRADGPRLAGLLRTGQRLVSPEGDLWRWDGFAADAHAPTGAARRLAQRARYAEIEAELKSAQAEVETRRIAAEVAETEVAAAATAQSDAQAAEREFGRNAARISALVEAHARLIASRDEASAARAEAERALADLPPASDLETRLAAVLDEISGRRGALAEVQAEAQALAREAELADRRLQAIAADRQDWSGRRDGAAQQIATLEARTAEAEAERAELEKAPEAFADRRSSLIGEVAGAEAARRNAADALAAAENALAEADKAARIALEAVGEARTEAARAEERHEATKRRLSDIAREIRDMLEVEPSAVAELAEIKPGAEPPPVPEVEERLERLRRERERLGAVNLRAEEELREIETQHGNLARERDDLVEAIKRLRLGIQSLNREARERLLASFAIVNGHFEKLFTRLFGGGNAQLHLIESDDPLEAGLEIMARPPGKKLTTLSLLSGGEQALTALALIFAVFLTNPAPICVLDEVDAPLDDHNVERFCDLLDEMTKSTDTRFVIITHNPITMSRMNRLYGVTMAERGVSQLVSVDLEGAVKLREAV